MKTTTHPVLTLLTINEDGTQMWYDGREIIVKSYKNDRDNYPFKRVAFAGRTHTVPKLVCEAWNGMRDDMTQVVNRKDKNPLNDHYTNLYWSHRGKVQTARTKRNTRSKIKADEVADVLKRIQAGETLTKIGNSYNTSCMSIQRIKNRWMQNRTLKLKQSIMHATNNYDRQQAYAAYLGYKNVTDAIAAYGTHKFKAKTEALAMSI